MQISQFCTEDGALLRVEWTYKRGLRGSRDAYGAPLEPDDDDEAVFESATLEDETVWVVVGIEEVLELLGCSEYQLTNLLFQDEL